MDVNAVFEGGGVRGVALAGAAAAAIELGLRFRQVAGTSAGALVAGLVAAGFTADELADAVCATDWPDLLDPVPGAWIPGIGRHLAMATRRGIYRGDRLEAVWGDLLARKGVRTFGDLAPDALLVVATDLSHARGLVLPRDLRRLGIEPASFSVARALRISASVPFLFRPVTLVDSRTGERVVLSDGAMTANYPVGIVRQDRPVVGFRLRPDLHGRPHAAITGPFTLARAVVIAGIRARYCLPRPGTADVTEVEVPVAADLDFDVSRDEARAVFDRARDAATVDLGAFLAAGARARPAILGHADDAPESAPAPGETGSRR